MDATFSKDQIIIVYMALASIHWNISSDVNYSIISAIAEPTYQYVKKINT